LQIAPPDEIRWAGRLGIRGVSALPARLGPAVAARLAA
jgi:hypothetical protein